MVPINGVSTGVYRLGVLCCEDAYISAHNMGSYVDEVYGMMTAELKQGNQREM